MKALARALETASKTRARLGKIAALGDALKALADAGASDDELAVATRLAAGRTLPVRDARTLGVGYALLFETLVATTGQDADLARMCARATGDLGEAFALLVARDRARESRDSSGLTMREVATLFAALAATGVRAEKRRLLDEAFARTSPVETKYLARALLAEMRIGVQEGVLEEAVAKAFGAPLAVLRRAAAMVTDVGDVAVLARDEELETATLDVGRPAAFMLASPIETVKTEINLARTVVEDKIDGVRAQIHVSNGMARIFARGLDDVTIAFPEVANAFAQVDGDLVLDGELLVVGAGGRVRPFQALQSRLRKTGPTKELLANAPVTFFAYDLLFDGESCLALSWDLRRARLEAFAATRSPGPILILNAYRAFDADGAASGARSFDAQLDAEFTAARARGHEGLVLKSRDAPYDAGRRGQAWLKVKRAFATLDVVVTAAEGGHGRRAGVLSDYTFGVWREPSADEAGRERALVNVGKAYSGLTDVEIDGLTARLEKLTVEKFGGVRVVEPVIVLEVAFDGIQRSKRHKSGFALRFPRIVRIRDDKTAAEADTLAGVETLFLAQVASGHREEDAAREAGEPEETRHTEASAAATTKTRKPTKATKSRTAKGAGASPQLSLFGAAPTVAKR